MIFAGSAKQTVPMQYTLITPPLSGTTGITSSDQIVSASNCKGRPPSASIRKAGSYAITYKMEQTVKLIDHVQLCDTDYILS